MAGTAQNNLRSAFVAETTAGTIPGTPGFSTSHDPILMKATTEVYEQTSLTVGGARAGVGIKSLPVTGTISGALVYGVLDDLWASLLQGSWASNVLKDAKTASTFTIENRITAGAGGTNTMMRYRGVQPPGGKLTLASNSEVQYSLDLVGMGSDDATTTALTGATYTDPTNAVPLTSGIDVGAITMAGYTPGGFQSAEIDFIFDGRTPQQSVSGLDTGGTTIGAFRPKITAKAYVDASFAAIYTAARAAHTAFAVAFAIGSVSGSKYTIQFPKCHFGSGDIDLSGTDLLQDIELLPIYDSTSGATVTMTRAVA